MPKSQGLNTNITKMGILVRIFKKLRTVYEKEITNKGYLN
jgi:hypothetical protein